MPKNSKNNRSNKDDGSDLFFGYTRDFLFTRLREQDLKSDNTIKAYRQGLNKFRCFMLSEYGKGVDKVRFDMVTAEIVRKYLKHLLDEGAALTTRNHRLTCLKQYMMYCVERNVELTQFYLPISKIKQVTTHPKKGIWMTREAVLAVLSQPPKTKLGIRDRFLMVFLYGTGARISEALNVKLKDIETLTKESFVRLIGKGNKPRCVPLLDITLENLDYYLGLHHPDKNPDDYLFYTVIKGHKDKMSVANAGRFIKKYGVQAKAYCPQIPESVHPHLFRHSYGAHLYRMGFSLPVIAKLLDHESLSTTERYAETDSDMVNQAFKAADEIVAAFNGIAPAEKKWKAADEETLAKLYGLI
jgi:site-specific recombinase XerD